MNVRGHTIAFVLAIGLLIMVQPQQLPLIVPRSTGNGFAEATQISQVGTESSQLVSWTSVANGIGPVQTSSSGVAFTVAGVMAFVSGIQQGESGPQFVYFLPSPLLARELTPLDLFAPKNRNRLEVYASILTVTAFDSLTISQIALLLRMNFKQTRESLDILISKGMLEEIPGDSICYRATERGAHFVEYVKSAMRMLG